MIEITKSATADTRTCDFANTTKETLLASSRATRSHGWTWILSHLRSFLAGRK